ncbi:MAG: hypothetical protein PUC05_09220 [Firmicutes bacterium]|nr:hypothetical protein [Bacillota bacterium]
MKIITVYGDKSDFVSLKHIFDALEAGDTVRLEGRFDLEPGAGESLAVSASGVTVDASDAFINIRQKLAGEEQSFIAVEPGVSGVNINGLHIDYSYTGPIHSGTAAVLLNRGNHVRVKGADISMRSGIQINMTGICNDAQGIPEHRGRCFSAEDCRVRIFQNPDIFSQPSCSCGIANRGGDNFYCSGCYVFAQNNGDGKRQTAIGVYNSGFAALIDNNNIKGNGSHNAGTDVRRCYAYGGVDESVSSVWSNNNLVGEWGGSCCAILCKGRDTRVCHSKLLGTHTIKGRTVKLYGRGCIVDNNIITTTSRNPRLIQVRGENCRITGNMLDAVLGRWDVYNTACGIYFDGVKSGYAADNAIMILKDCGIFLDRSSVILRNNTIYDNIYNPMYLGTASSDNAEMLSRLAWDNTAE